MHAQEDTACLLELLITNCSDFFCMLLRFLLTACSIQHQGLATLLETTKYGCCDLKQALWSTQMLEDCPDKVREAHVEFMVDGGADIIIACTYQTSLVGFAGNVAKFEQALDTACRVGHDAIRIAQQQQQHRPILLAGSLGAYGACLENGAEYTGNYHFPVTTPEEREAARTVLKDYHVPRMHYLQQKVDIFAAETIPVGLEGSVVSELFVALQHPGYLVFACRSATQLGNGDLLRHVLRHQITYSPYLLGLGINCTSIKYITNLVTIIREELDIRFSEDDDGTTTGGGESRSRRPRIVVYPNSGELYCGQQKIWVPDPDLAFEVGRPPPQDTTKAEDANRNNDHDTTTTVDNTATRTTTTKSYSDYAVEWYTAGATVIGGCCRVTPQQIRDVKTKLKNTTTHSY